jgi:hypothetical protein
MNPTEKLLFSRRSALTGKGFPLIGRRLDYLDPRNVGVVIHSTNAHIINLYVCPAHETMPSFEVKHTKQCFNLRHWQEVDLQFWVISDVNPTKLEEFKALYRGQQPKSK